MLISKIYTVTLPDCTSVDVDFSVDFAKRIEIDQVQDTEYNYDIAGLDAQQLDQAEEIITSNIDEWVEEIVEENAPVDEDEEYEL